ncbi:MAG: esterase-like activity of phytase family protein [Hyphomonadaceae bacterium]|nr:esterase-like activity of phytase family protein [Hyphomonadaceae bacterium]MBX3509626.1 esterase-like activity of phytase family protein [Hyphomonadaceae bacterium]
MRGLALALCAALLSACAPSAAQAPIVDQWRAVAIETTLVELGVAETGRLRFRGGLALSSSDVAFGGLSGLEIVGEGELVAVSDDGAWFEAQLMLDEAGALIGLAHARMALMRDETGEPFANKRAGDAEALAHLPDGRFAVAFEQTQSIRIYDLNRDGPFGAAQRGPRLAEVRRLPPNAGLEAMAADEDRALIVGAEGGGGTTPLWRVALSAAEPAPPLARLRLPVGYSLTSLDRLPDGGFVALQRFYAPVIGARARIVRIAADALRADAEVAGEEWATLAPPMPVDNFEGIAAVRTADGGTRLYIVSDDNFSARQRTLLYAFDVIEPRAD